MQQRRIAQLLSSIGLVVLLVYSAAAAAQDSSRLSGAVRMGLEYDDNPLRLQADDPRLESDDPSFDYLHLDPDMLARYFTSLDSTHRTPNNARLRLGVRHGGKFYRHSREADALLTEVRAGYRYPLADEVALLVDAEVKDRTERRSRFDYTRGGARAGLSFRPGDWRLSARAGWRFFAYKPAPRLGSQGPQFDAYMRRYFGESWATEASYGLVLRDFDDDRSDTFHWGRAGIVYRSDFFVDLMYVVSVNRSTLESQNLTRQGVRMTLTTPLFEQFYGSARAELQRTAVPDQSTPDALFFVDEENRNVLVASIARPIGEDWELEGRWSMYIEEFSDSRQDVGRIDLDYSRQTFLVALGWGFE